MNIKPITEICLNVTEACDANCVYCFAEHHPHTISLQTAKDAIDWVAANAEGIGEDGIIGFFGGEPLLVWDNIIVPVVKYVREEKDDWRMGLGITSNCYSMTEERLQFLKRYDVGLLVSCDGCEETQNYNRPLKSGKLPGPIMTNILPIVSKYYPEATFRSTIIPETCHLFCDNLEYAGRMGFKNTFMIIDELSPWPQEAREELGKQVRVYSNYLVKSFLNNEPIIRLRPLEQALVKIAIINYRANKGYTQDIKDEVRTCGVGSGYGSINYKGDIYSCQEVASRQGEKDIFYLGNIYTGGIDKERIEKLISMNDQAGKIRNKEHPEKCKDCPLEMTCYNNTCIVNNYINNQDLALQNDSKCWWNNLMLREAQYLCIELGENEAFQEYFEAIITGEGGCFNNV